MRNERVREFCLNEQARVGRMAARLAEEGQHEWADTLHKIAEQFGSMARAAQLVA
jgi:hypothetical protein